MTRYQRAIGDVSRFGSRLKRASGPRGHPALCRVYGGCASKATGSAIALRRETAQALSGVPLWWYERIKLTQAIRAICFPQEDSVFSHYVDNLVQSVADEHGPIDAAIQSLLRVTYPLAVVSARRRVASFDDGYLVYVMRDGAVVSREQGS